MGHEQAPKWTSKVLCTLLVVFGICGLYEEWTYLSSAFPVQGASVRESRLWNFGFRNEASSNASQGDSSSKGTGSAYAATEESLAPRGNLSHSDICVDRGFQCLWGNRPRATLANERVVRALVAFLPSNAIDRFGPELLGLYRSWLYMLERQRPRWRMDFVLATDNTSASSLADLGCSTEIRNNSSGPDKCVLVPYVPMDRRTSFQTDLEENRVQALKNYKYADSVLPVAELERMLTQSYDYVMRTDLDTFLLPSLGKFIPDGCQLITGAGAYHHEFSMYKLQQVAIRLGYKPTNVSNWGSTWFGPPAAVARAANRTLSVMEHLHLREFTTPEKQYKFGADTWPEWYYGVILLYGGHVVLGDLYESSCAVQKTPEKMDWPADSPQRCDSEDHIHMHVFHGMQRFSKFMHKKGEYSDISLDTLNLSVCNDFATYMALDGERRGYVGLGELYKAHKVQGKRE